MAQRIEVVNKVREVLEDCTEDPAVELRKFGEAIVKIADALKGLSLADAKNVMRAVATLDGDR